MKNKALWSAFAYGLIVVATLCYSRAMQARSEPDNSSPEALDGKGLRAEAMEREAFLISMHGFEFGVPRTAYANAVRQTQTMRVAEEAARAALRTVPEQGSGTWTFIGPLPIRGQQANFGGATFGPQFNPTGRISALAGDPAGNLYVGAASGGGGLSRDGGAPFTPTGGTRRPQPR